MTPAASLVQRAWEDMWTHQLWSTGERRQIDYLLVDSMRAETVQEAGVWRQLEGKSDHRALYAEVACRYKTGESVRRERKMRGWAPELDKDGKPTSYHELLTKALSGGHNDVMDVNGLVVTAARATSNCISKPPRVHSEEVQNLFSERPAAACASTRQELSKRYSIVIGIPISVEGMLSLEVICQVAFL